MTTSKNLDLALPENSDFVDVDELSANFEIIDAEIEKIEKTFNQNAVSVGRREGSGRVGAHSAVFGQSCVASGDNSVAIGYMTESAGFNQFVCGAYNVPDTDDEYAFIVGNGRPGDLRNAATIAKNGTANFFKVYSQGPINAPEIVCEQFGVEHDLRNVPPRETGFYYPTKSSYSVNNVFTEFGISANFAVLKFTAIAKTASNMYFADFYISGDTRSTGASLDVAAKSSQLNVSYDATAKSITFEAPERMTRLYVDCDTIHSEN